MNPTPGDIFHEVGILETGVRDTLDARQVLLTGFRPSDPSAPRGEQARDVLEQMRRALQEADCTFSHVVRTWFYLDDILGWYDEFNTARTAFFETHCIFDGIVPASTAVGLAGLDVALTGAVLAVKPGAGQAEVEAVASPLQCPALDYKSSFSRAVEVRMGTGQTLYISGTASIDDDGLTAYRGDVGRQIELTLAVVDAMLVARSLEWSHVTRAVAYFPTLSDAGQLPAQLASLGMDTSVLRCIEATVCRADLLFEIEIDAVRNLPDQAPPR